MDQERLKRSLKASPGGPPAASALGLLDDLRDRVVTADRMLEYLEGEVDSDQLAEFVRAVRLRLGIMAVEGD